MPDTNGTFRPLGKSDRRLHGQPALLVCGFDAPDRRRLQRLLGERTLAHLPLIFVTDAERGLTLRALAHRTGLGEAATDSDLARAIVMSGLTEQELHRLMKAYREAGLPHTLWATVTPHSENWTIETLLTELTRERDALQSAMRQSRRQAP